MYVQQFMKTPVLTISPEDDVMKAMNIMKTKRVNRLPVVEKGKVVGIVSDGDLRKAGPSEATTLSKHEINELLSKLKIKDIASKKVIFCSPDDLIEDAALEMREHNVGALPVIDGDELVGIITRNDILGAFLEVMGARSPGQRVVIEVKDERGKMNEITELIIEYELDIINLAVYHKADRKAQILSRLNGDRIDEALEELKARGYTIL